ncbi:hypothetical protein B484DRAFT_103225 [Ochromonadaceae sp. CCMP2298]|nr:hypothetical protein B484DRAFT_103225 [Ochromonadaceae sp. CCMP2298]
MRALLLLLLLSTDKFWQSYSCDALPHPQNHTAAPDRSLLTAPSPACFPRTRASGIPVYYINADKDVQRRADMEKQLERLGLPYRRIAGMSIGCYTLIWLICTMLILYSTMHCIITNTAQLSPRSRMSTEWDCWSSHASATRPQTWQ